MQYNDGYDEKVYSFANNINTVDGGTHLSGFRSAFTRTINAYAQSSGLAKNFKGSLTGDDVREGWSRSSPSRCRSRSLKDRRRASSIQT